MKVVNAFWEKRNLGVDCFEITIENNDTSEMVQRSLPGYISEYAVVKVPSARTDIMFALSDIGYKFIECSMHVTNDLRNCELQGIPKRLSDAVDYAPMDKSDIDVLFKEIRAGLFNTDRIILDPYFTPQQGANRYIGWISDELERGSVIYKLVNKNKTIGFFTFKELKNNIYYPFLAGLYKDSNFSGLGFNIVYKPMLEAKKRNGRLISTYISSNNLNAVHLHMMFNYKIEDINYVYVKHF